MPYLLDTSILVRLANVRDSQYVSARNAVLELHHRGAMLRIAPQNLIEFRNVATRPVHVNGLGLPPADAEFKAAIFESSFSLLEDTPDVFPAWKSLVEAVGVIGKQVHDARLVAVCHVHSVSHILTFNSSHFTSMAAFGPGVTVVDPANI